MTERGRGAGKAGCVGGLRAHQLPEGARDVVGNQASVNITLGFYYENVVHDPASVLSDHSCFPTACSGSTPWLFALESV